MYISVMRKEWKHSRDLSIVYNYKATVSATVTDNSDKSGKILTQNDYELEYENNTNAGNSACVTVIGKGEYAGAKTVRKLYRYSKKRVCN